MASLGRMERLEGNPWLYTRIKQRISEIDQQDAPVPSLMRQLQPLFLVLLLLVNIWTAFTVFDNTTSEEEYFETLADEYSSNADQLINYLIEE